MSNINTAALSAAIAEAVTAAVVAALVPAEAPATTKASTKAKAKGKSTSKAPVVTGGPTFKEAQAALVVLKAEGKAPAGMTTKQAIEAGLLPALGATAKVGKAKGKKAKKAKPEGTSFTELRARLVALKAEGLVPAGVSVRQAQAQGLVDDEVRFIGTAPKAAPKASKKAKAKARKAEVEKVAAKVEADAPAKARPAGADAPRRADGTITPKSEWALREALAETGKFDRHEIDAAVSALNA
jgi:hypothetical protein